jgi:hypothetical protein
MTALDAIKKMFFEHALALGEVAVRFDGTAEGVGLPEGLDVSQPVTFAYGLHQPRPIPDLVATEKGIAATLAFGPSSKPTFVPWTAVISIGGANCAAIFLPEAPKVLQPEPPPMPMRGKLRSV